MSPMAFALIVSGAVLAVTAPALYAIVRWHTRTTERLERLAGIYGLERQPGESNRSLRARVVARAQTVFLVPTTRRRRRL